MSVSWNGDGSSWWEGMRNWLRANWLVLTVAAACVGWVVRVEVFAQTGKRFTESDAIKMELRWEEKFDSLPPAAYVKYVDSRFDSLEKQLDSRFDTVDAKLSLIKDSIKDSK